MSSNHLQPFLHNFVIANYKNDRLPQVKSRNNYEDQLIYTAEDLLRSIKTERLVLTERSSQ